MVWVVRNGNVVQGEKLWSWVKRWWREVWSRERNCGFGSRAGGGKCGPGSQTAGLGQAPPRPSVVRGEKLWSWVKHWWREVWSRERNCGFGSSPASPECGPRREIMVFGQALMAGSMVQGAKLRVWVKLSPAIAWSREQNRAPGSSPSPPKCGLGSKTVPPGQARPCPGMVQGAKPCPRVKPDPTVAWSREPNRAPGSPPAPP